MLYDKHDIQRLFYATARAYGLGRWPTRDMVVRIFGARLDWFLGDHLLRGLIDRRPSGDYTDLGTLEALAVSEITAKNSSQPYTCEDDIMDDIYWRWLCFIDSDEDM